MSSPVNTRQERLESPAAGAAHGAEPAGSRGGSVGSSGELMHARALRTERMERPRPVPNRPGAREVVDCTLRDGPMCSATRAAPQLMRPLRSPSIPPRIRTSASGSPARRAALAAALMSAPPPGSVPPPPVSTPPLGTLRTRWTKVSGPARRWFSSPRDLRETLPRRSARPGVNIGSLCRSRLAVQVVSGRP